jgi:hypothetical protein
MTEKEIRLDEIAHFQKFLNDNGVTNTVLLGHAETRRRHLDSEFPNEAPVDHSREEADRQAEVDRERDAKVNAEREEANQREEENRRHQEWEQQEKERAAQIHPNPTDEPLIR